MTHDFSVEDDLNGADIAVLHSEAPNRWQVVCEHLRCAPPACSFPGWRTLVKDQFLTEPLKRTQSQDARGLDVIGRHGSLSPVSGGKAFAPSRHEDGQTCTGTSVRISDCLEYLDTRRWLLRHDTFTDNLALFRPSNVEFRSGVGVAFSVRREPLGVRDYTRRFVIQSRSILIRKIRSDHSRHQMCPGWSPDSFSTATHHDRK